MGDRSRIEWTDATWNPTTGCSKVSPGCKHCYAKREWARLSANPKSRYYGREFEDVRMHDDLLAKPLHWRRPRRIFVDSMSDLFHEDIDDRFLDRVFAVIAMAPQHTFQILTKRQKRMRNYVGAGGRGAAVFDFMRNSELGFWAGAEKLPPQSWPLPNVWLGISAEDQKTFDERWPHLRDTPAAKRIVSLEPLLGPIDVGEALIDCMGAPLGLLHQVIDGGESGPGARPSHLQWFRMLRDQCAAAGMPYLHKQNGEWIECETEVMTEPPWNAVYPIDESIELKDGRAYKVIKEQGTEFCRVGKRDAGRLLDGREHSEFPK